MQRKGRTSIHQLWKGMDALTAGALSPLGKDSTLMAGSGSNYLNGESMVSYSSIGMPKLGPLVRAGAILLMYAVSVLGAPDKSLKPFS